MVLVVAGCGEDNPGEPRTPAENLVAPSAKSVDGSVHVYCVESDAIRGVTPCEVSIELKNAPSPGVLGAWWLRGARALHQIGTFSYKGKRWRFDYFIIVEPGTDSEGHSRLFGWRCASDAGKSAQTVGDAMYLRDPFQKFEIQSLSEAQRLGCVVSRVPPWRE